MRDLHLHVGPQKTGSTYLHALLAANRPRLEARASASRPTATTRRPARHYLAFIAALRGKGMARGARRDRGGPGRARARHRRGPGDASCSCRSDRGRGAAAGARPRTRRRRRISARASSTSRAGRTIWPRATSSRGSRPGIPAARPTIPSRTTTTTAACAGSRRSSGGRTSRCSSTATGRPNDLAGAFFAAIGLGGVLARLDRDVGRRNVSLHRRKVLLLAHVPKNRRRRPSLLVPPGLPEVVVEVVAGSPAVADDGIRFTCSRPTARRALVARHLDGNRALVARYGIADPGGFVELPPPDPAWTPPAPISNREIARGLPRDRRRRLAARGGPLRRAASGPRGSPGSSPASPRAPPPRARPEPPRDRSPACAARRRPRSPPRRSLLRRAPRPRRAGRPRAAAARRRWPAPGRGPAAARLARLAGAGAGRSGRRRSRRCAAPAGCGRARASSPRPRRCSPPGRRAGRRRRRASPRSAAAAPAPRARPPPRRCCGPAGPAAGLDLALPARDRPAALPRELAGRIVLYTAAFGDAPPPAPLLPGAAGPALPAADRPRPRGAGLGDAAHAAAGARSRPARCSSPASAAPRLLAAAAPEAEASLFLDPAHADHRQPRHPARPLALAAGPGALAPPGGARLARGDRGAADRGPARRSRARWSTLAAACTAGRAAARRRGLRQPGDLAPAPGRARRGADGRLVGARRRGARDRGRGAGRAARRPRRPARAPGDPARRARPGRGQPVLRRRALARPRPPRAPRARARPPAGPLPVAFLYAEQFAASASTFLRMGQLAEIVAEHYPERFAVTWTSDGRGPARPGGGAGQGGAADARPRGDRGACARATSR